MNFNQDVRDIFRKEIVNKAQVENRAIKNAGDVVDQAMHKVIQIYRFKAVDEWAEIGFDDFHARLEVHLHDMVNIDLGTIANIDEITLSIAVIINTNYNLIKR